MNDADPRYAAFALAREMLEVPAAVRGLDLERITRFAPMVRGSSVLLSGEGSSRIFPARKAISDSWRRRGRDRVHTEGATQALEYDLADSTVFVASNSGRTKEALRLIRKLRGGGCRGLYGVVANAGTPIADEVDEAYVLSCGPERAVAATKSVVEQALFYDLLFRARDGLPPHDLPALAELMDRALRAPVPPAIVEAMKRAGVLYWAGRDDGVAEELALKTNEIVRKKSGFFEGTYAAHGVEEVLDRGDVVVVVEPFPEEEEKFEQVLVRGVGLTVVAIASRETRFPTLGIGGAAELAPYAQLCAGWNLLVEAGLGLGVDLDRPARARKIGNEI